MLSSLSLGSGPAAQAAKGLTRASRRASCGSPLWSKSMERRDQVCWAEKTAQDKQDNSGKQNSAGF